MSGMKHRSNGRAFFVLSAIALAAFQGCARKGPSPDIVIAKDASWHERAAAAELGVDRCNEIAAVVMADYFCNCRWVESEASVLDGIDHPLNRAVL